MLNCFKVAECAFRGAEKRRRRAVYIQINA